MKKAFRRTRLWACLAGGCLLQGCMTGTGQTLLDPDLTVRAGLSIASDFAVFLLENLLAST